MLELGSVLVESISVCSVLKTPRLVSNRRYKVDPTRGSVLVKLIQLDQQVCRWDRLPVITSEFLRIVDDPTKCGPDDIAPPLTLLSIPEATREQQKILAEKFDRFQNKLYGPAQPAYRSSLRSPSSATTMSDLSPSERWKAGESLEGNRRIRIGYLSADFRSHPVAMLLAETIEYQDRERFEVFAYSFGPDDGSSWRKRIERAVDQFVDMEAWSFDRSIQRIVDDRIDILIDLQGHTGDGRSEILLHRPAPVQVLFLGYAGTSGARHIDFAVVDKRVVPPEASEAFSEKLVYLPNCYMPADSKRLDNVSRYSIDERLEARRRSDLPDNGIVYCCFSASYKIAKPIFDVWLNVLRRVPDSVLWLRIDLPSTIRNLRDYTQAAGLDPSRLVFSERVSVTEHLTRHQLADLYLDTYPYNQHSTAGDAIRLGLPLITCSGETMASRVAGSYLKALALDELVTESLSDYEAKIVELSESPGELKRVRETLEKSLETTDLFDGRAFAQKLEAAYWAMFKQFLSGQPFQTIDLSGGLLRV